MRKLVIFSSIFSVFFLIRYYLSTLLFNNDFYNYLTWVDSLKAQGLGGFYQRDFSPFAGANYPPLINLLYLFFDQMGHYLFPVNLKMNILASLYKLPGLILETALITYLFSRRQILMSLIIALNPAIFFNTIFWGQTEGIITSLVFFSLITSLNSQIILGLALFTLALLVKQSTLVFLPILVAIIFKKTLFKKAVSGILISGALIWLLFLPFNNYKLDLFPVKFFLETAGGQPHQHLASVNAFNFWYLLKSNQIPDSITYFLTLRQWGILIVFLLISAITTKLFRLKQANLAKYLVAAGLINFAAFLFLTRIHERHLLPTLVLLLPLAINSKLNFLLYLLLSVVSFINLIWVWFFDHSLELSIYLTDSTTALLALISLGCFAYFLRAFLRLSNREEP